MTDSMNFGPDWIRNLSSEGSTGGGTSGTMKYQLADYRYGREEMLALFDRTSKPPASVTNFKYLYSEQTLVPLALLPTPEEERGWQGRPATLAGGPVRGRGGSLERGGRISRGRGGYQYSRTSTYDGDQADWSPRKEYGMRTPSLENWRRGRSGDQEDDGWRGVGLGRSSVHDKWGRSTSWRGEGDADDKLGQPERSARSGWGDTNRAPPGRRSWDNEDHLPEWANENPTEGGGSFDEKGAFHGSDDEQLEVKHPVRAEPGLQKSVSQQHISAKIQPPPLSTSKSTMALVKPEDSSRKKEEQKGKEDNKGTENVRESTDIKRKKSVSNILEKSDKPGVQERAKSEDPPKLVEKHQPISNGPVQDVLKTEESDFERLQEDFVRKLMGEEELPKLTPSAFEGGSLQPPPNLIPPAIQDKWFYQDPQGQMQGPFSNIEMAEWYKAGYFSNQLKVRRQSDERFFLLGELIALCGGVNPFTSGIRFPVLKNDITKMPDPELLQFQYLSQLAAYKQAQTRILQEPWSALTLQQQELAAQRLIIQQQQVPQDLQFMQQSQAANPLMHMINQMQQANKLPGQGLVDKQPPTIPPSLDPHLQLHMSNLISMQNRLPTTSMTNSIPAGLTGSLTGPAGLTGNLAGTLPPEGISSSMPNLQATIPLSSLKNSIPVSIGSSINSPRPTSHTSVDQISSTQENDPISSLLKQLQQQKQQSQQIDSLWQQNQYNVTTPSAVPSAQWKTPNEIPLSMWDVTQNSLPPPSSLPPDNVTEKVQHHVQPEAQQSQTKQQRKADVDKDREQEEASAIENKKRKEQEERQAKKEAEEKRKIELKKQETEKKAAEERKKKEEERVRRELERAKKEAEEKRLRELEEKRRLKEQRRAEEEARKKSEEMRKSEEERIRHELKEVEERRQAEERRLQQEQIRNAKAAPWSQSNSTLGMSLADIQRAEKEKRAQDAALQIQRLQEKEQMQIQQEQQQQQQERISGGSQFNWAKKPILPKTVKSLAEIQAEEQNQVAKQAAELRLQKEKDTVPVVNNTSSIWNGQNLSWANASGTSSQWSASTGGFWDDSSNRQGANKPSNVTKSNSTSSFNVSKQQQQNVQKPQTKASKAKKEEANKNTNHNNNNNGPSTDEFTTWCYSTLAKIVTDIDIPTFVTFLRDIESAFDVREYCKEYLGDSNATHQFASNFLEKRRSFKPKNNAHKDDMCSPAPAITPSSLQHSTEFQEVKGKNKKNKKSKMFKVDSRILGFNVTSAPDRINVGDRDYGDNS